MKVRPYSRIIVEGMDGSGKTTLINQLEEHFGDRGLVVPGYNRIPEPKAEIDQWWMEQLGHNPVEKVVIHDRFFYPEFVYGPILRGKIKATASTIQYVEKFLAEHAFLVYCRPPNQVVTDGFEKEDQMEGVRPNFWKLLVQYDKLMIEIAPNYNGRFMKYDWSDDTHYRKLLSRLSGYIY